MLIYRSMFKLLTIILVAFLLSEALPSQGQQFTKLTEKDQNLNDVFLGGYVNYTVPLSIFLPERIQPGVTALRTGHKAVAEKIFAREITSHPDDLAAYVGYIQAAPEKWDALFTDYQQEAAVKPNSINEFKLGVLAFYFTRGRATDGTVPPNQNNDDIIVVSDLARSMLQHSFDQTKAPITGFMLGNALQSAGVQVPVYEYMLKDIGGEAEYNAYALAKSREWVAAQPPLPMLPRKDLLIVSSIVHKIWSSHSERTGSPLTQTVDGKQIESIQFDDYTLEQKRARAFLWQWEMRLKSAALKE